MKWCRWYDVYSGRWSIESKIWSRGMFGREEIYERNSMESFALKLCVTYSKLLRWNESSHNLNVTLSSQHTTYKTHLHYVHYTFADRTIHIYGSGHQRISSKPSAEFNASKGVCCPSLSYYISYFFSVSVIDACAQTQTQLVIYPRWLNTRT